VCVCVCGGVLSYIEYRTSAIYHACDSLLYPLDRVQGRVVEIAGMSERDALLNSNLAPLSMRRDIAMLGVIHRAVLGKGPRQFFRFFTRDAGATSKHRLGIREYRNGDLTDYLYPGSQPAQYVQRSALGLTSIYNLLPASIVERSSCVQSFQRALQSLAKDHASDKVAGWQCLFSPRVALSKHLLQNVA
jgi:hypothetical protein